MLLKIYFSTTSTSITSSPIMLIRLYGITSSSSLFSIPKKRGGPGTTIERINPEHWSTSRSHMHPNLEPSEFESLYETMVTKLKALGKNVVMLNLPPIDAEKYFAWISRDRSAKNILNWLGGDEHYIYTWHEMYNKALSSVAKRQSVPLLDIRSAFLDRRDYADLICEDGIHPNEEGHKLIAETLLKACEESPFFGKVLV